MMRNLGRGIGLLFLVLAIVAGGIILYFYINKSPEEQALNTVDTFYKYEQAGEFSQSWSMFHPLMKDKFSKGYYIQDRAHVFMNHFGVTTFSYTLREPVKVTNWKIEKGAKPIDVAYKVTVTQVYKSKYGKFSLIQDVYTTQVKGKWKILWSYMK